MVLTMSCALYTNEPSALNTIYCGAGINFCRDQIRKAELKSGNYSERMMTRFVGALGMELFGLTSSMEAVARLVDIFRLYICFRLSPKSYQQDLQTGIERFLLASRVSLIATNPVSSCALLALSALPNAFKPDHDEENDLYTARKYDIGSLAMPQNSHSFLDSTYFGRKIHQACIDQTEQEKQEMTTKQLILSRLKTFSVCLFSAIFSVTEFITYSLALINYGLFLSSLTNEKFRTLLKISEEEFNNKMLNLENITQKFLISLFIVSTIWTPFSSLSHQCFLLLTLMAEMVQKGAFRTTPPLEAEVITR